MQEQKPNIPVDVATPLDVKAKNKPTPLWSKLLTIVVLAGVAVIAVSLLPRGYSQDISLIGKGDKVVVLFQEPFTVDGQENIDAMNEIRSEFDGRVKFIVADKKVEQGKKFTDLYGVDSTAFVFFAPNGEKINTIYGRQIPDSLRKHINQAFNF